MQIPELFNISKNDRMIFKHFHACGSETIREYNDCKVIILVGESNLTDEAKAEELFSGAKCRQCEKLANLK